MRAWRVRRASKSTTPFSLMKVARLVRGIFKPLRASGAAATKNRRRAETVANFICIVKKRLEGCELVKPDGEVRGRNELGQPAARVVPMFRSAQVLYVS